MKNFISAIVFLVTINIFPQADTILFTHTYPIIGWDSLSSIIQRPETYPEIGRLAGATISLSIYLTIDSTGKFIKVELVHKPSNLSDSLNNKLFIPPIETILKSVEWVPGIRDNKHVEDTIYLLFNFFLTDPYNKSFNIIAPIRYIEKVN
ncbi:MAG: hypothetical protein A2V93_01895 [Ignavibacteria bacterium RBG_16_34_14]|nr:MAG: hypothetical protein A2V93_01895 [Ignavibacteria bacterium RBG_16_34_14]